MDTKYRILLGVPSDGHLSEPSCQASFLAALHHPLDRIPSCNAGANFNSVWCTALNACMAPNGREWGGPGHYTHFAMMHTDIAVEIDPKIEGDFRWGDILIDELEKHPDADFISCPIAIKDLRGLSMCGVGDPRTRWNPYRRLCGNEFFRGKMTDGAGKIITLPTTFCKDDIGQADRYLIHSNALCMFDMRKPVWYKTVRHPEDDFEHCGAIFNFTEDLRLVDTTDKDGKPCKAWHRFQDSEDWAFSRDLWKIGAKSYITSRITINHRGSLWFSNKDEGGTYQNGDEDTADNWRVGGRAPATATFNPTFGEYESKAGEVDKTLDPKGIDGQSAHNPCRRGDIPASKRQAPIVKIEPKGSAMLTHDDLTEEMKSTISKVKLHNENLEHLTKEFEDAKAKALAQVQAELDKTQQKINAEKFELAKAQIEQNTLVKLLQKSIVAGGAAGEFDKKFDEKKNGDAAPAACHQS